MRLLRARRGRKRRPGTHERPRPGGRFPGPAKRSLREHGAGGGPFRQVVASSHGSDAAHRRLGRLARSGATHSAPGTPDLSRSASFTYNAKHLLTSEAAQPGSPLALVTKRRYDRFGNAVRVESRPAAGGTARATATAYDAIGRFAVSAANAVGHTEAYVRGTRFGELRSRTGPNGRATTWTHDGFGRTLSTTHPNGVTDHVARHWLPDPMCPDADGRAVRCEVSWSQAPGGAVTGRRVACIDRLGRTVRAASTGFDGRAVLADTRFDALGRVASVSRSRFDGDPVYVTAFEHDALGRETRRREQRKGGGWRETLTAYDGVSVTVTAPDGRRERRRLDAAGRLVEAVADLGGLDVRTVHTHDAMGNLLSSRVAGGRATTIEYDALGNKTSMTDPAMGTWNYRHNAFGETVWWADAKGATFSQTFDALGRRTSRTSSEGTGRERRLAESHARTARELLAEAGQVEAAWTSDTVAGAHVYWWRATERDAAGRVTRSVAGNGLATTHRHDPSNGELDSIATGLPWAPLRRLAYEYDDAGSVTRREDAVNGLSEDFAYDGLDRLVRSRATADDPGRPAAYRAETAYAYDARGNLLSKTGVGAYAYDANGRLASVTAPGAAASRYAYDKNGNTLSDGGRAMSWTSGNRLAEVSRGGAALRFAHAPSGGRHRQVAVTGSGTKVTHYMGAAYQRVEEGGSASHRHHVFVGGRLVAVREAPESPAAGAATTRWLHHDALGSVDLVTDHRGRVAAHQGFAPFGERRAGIAHPAARGAPLESAMLVAAATPRGFTGHESLKAVSLVHMNGRVYDPALGRFLSADPFVQSPHDGQSHNRYAYVLNNPLKYVDPSGYSSWTRFRDRVINVAVRAVQVAVAAALMAVGVPAWIAYPLVAARTALLLGGNSNDALRAGGSALLAVWVGGAPFAGGGSRGGGGGAILVAAVTGQAFGGDGPAPACSRTARGPRLSRSCST